MITSPANFKKTEVLYTHGPLKVIFFKRPNGTTVFRVTGTRAAPTLGGGAATGYDQLQVRVDDLIQRVQAQSKKWVTADKLISCLPVGLGSRKRLRELVAFGVVSQGKNPLTERPLYDLKAVLIKADQLVSSGVSLPGVSSRRRTKPLKVAL